MIRTYYVKNAVSKNQEKIDAAVSALKYTQDSVEDDKALLLPLLNLENLTETQLGQIYLLITTLNYTSGDMKAYFETVGKALFYTEYTNHTDETIYLYANMAKYFLELGARDEAYSVINKALKFGSFYDCENVLTRLQILQVYSDYLIHQKRYEEAYVAACQIIEDAKLTGGFNPDFPDNYARAGEIIKAQILFDQQKYYGANNLVSELLEKYSRPDEVVSQFSAFDFYMPAYYIKTMCALHEKDYDKAILLNEKYGKYCDSFFFTIKKIQLIQQIIRAMPPSMNDKKDMLAKILSNDSRNLVVSVISDYTFLANDKFSTIMTQLDLESEVRQKTQEVIHSAMFNIFIAIVGILLLYAVFIEAHTDSLTRLFSRRSLNAKIRKLEFLKSNYYAVMIDLDDFKKINDTYGHASGDEVLRKVAGVVLDAENRHVKAYRYGGEEIVVIFERTAFEDVIRTAEAMRSKISRLKFSRDMHITASFGVGAKPENPIRLADENLYYAKSKGKNIVAYKLNNIQYLAERRLQIRNPMPDTVAK